jgi:hypothetical protein
MGIGEIIDYLETMAEQLNRRAESLPWRRARHDQVEGLLALAAEVQGILVPVEPDSSFRRRLHGQLTLKGQSRPAKIETGLFQQHRKGILIGAAAVGSLASIAGVIVAYVLRHRQQDTSQIAAG